MHFSVIREHREFFRKNHWIECEGVLTKEELHRLDQGINSVLEKRLKVPKERIVDQAPDQVFAQGRDLWREAPTVKKIVQNRSLAEIAGELTEHKPLRFGYDMLLTAPSKYDDVTTVYGSLVSKTPTLVEISGIQGVLCGAMVCLSGSSHASEEKGSLFSTTPGNVVFFSPDWPLPFQEIMSRRGFTYLMIVYTQAKAVYCRTELDPHLHEFKRLGYNFGDRLTDVLNPIVYP